METESYDSLDRTILPYRYVLNTKEKSVRVKTFLLALKNVAQNKCALRY